MISSAILARSAAWLLLVTGMPLDTMYESPIVSTCKPTGKKTDFYLQFMLDQSLLIKRINIGAYYMSSTELSEYDFTSISTSQ